jgi:hypothetical protein
LSTGCVIVFAFDVEETVDKEVLRLFFCPSSGFSGSTPATCKMLCEYVFYVRYRDDDVFDIKPTHNFERTLTWSLFRIASTNADQFK